VNAFIDVLDTTDQKELVSVATFSSSATLDLALQSDYQLIRNLVNQTSPYGGTSIGQGLQTGLPSLLDTTRARPFASKTIVVLTDGQNNASPDPVSVVQSIVAQYNVTIHTVTISPDADQTAMIQIAALGHGKHYHANTGSDLLAIFEEIANNLPTMLTQ
jgi:Mg-chelatase subunit ChlD